MIDIFINVSDPCICPVDHLFCGRNHENGPGPVRSLGVVENANARVYGRNAHGMASAASSKPSRYGDDTARRGVVTRDDYGRNHFDRRLCESDVEMPTGYHRVCAVPSPGGDEAVEMESDCHLVCDQGNLACIDAAGSTNDDTTAGSESHLTSPIRYQNRTKNPLRMSLRPMNCPKTTTRLLTLPGVVP